MAKTLQGRRRQHFNIILIKPLQHTYPKISGEEMGCRDFRISEGVKDKEKIQRDLKSYKSLF
jgi:hypothetical protein